MPTVLAVCVLWTPLVWAYGQAAAPDATLKAAFLYNFAKFTQWPALPAGAPIVTCIIGDDEIATSFVQTVRGHNIGGHPLEVRRPGEGVSWRVCNLLFVSAAETGRSAAALAVIRGQPVLTVGDGKGFAQAGGIIELYVEARRFRFAVNVDAAGRSGVRLSSRLLELARVVRDGDAP